jgi:predicted small lipoprotein YifL
MLITKTAISGMMLLLILQLQGCGRKGPLFMPQEPAKPVPATKTQTEQAIPAAPKLPPPDQTIPSQTEPK